MEIKRSGSQPSGKGQPEYFNGEVRIDPLFQATEPARVIGAAVTFEPRCAHRLAYASTRPDFDRHVRSRLGSAVGRTD